MPRSLVPKRSAVWRPAVGDPLPQIPDVIQPRNKTFAPLGRQRAEAWLQATSAAPPLPLPAGEGCTRHQASCTRVRSHGATHATWLLRV